MLVISLLSLGGWQFKRAREKEQALDAINQHLQAATSSPVFTDADARAFEQESKDTFVIFSLSGRWDGNESIRVGCQKKKTTLMSSVFTPFCPTGGDKCLWVNRGQWPQSGNFPITTASEVNIQFRLRKPPAPSSFIATGSLDQRFFTKPFLSEMKRNLPTYVTLYGELIATSPGSSGPQPAPPHLQLQSLPPEQHYMYAFTWVALAICAFIIGFLTLYPRK